MLRTRGAGTRLARIDRIGNSRTFRYNRVSYLAERTRIDARLRTTAGRLNRKDTILVSIQE